MDRSEGTAYITYEDSRDARDAIAEFDGQNAYGQPIRLSLVPTAPAAKGREASSSLFDRVERPARSLFDRIESGAGGRDDGAGRRRDRSDSPRRRAVPDHVDRYVPGSRDSRSPMRRRGTPREPGRRPGQRREGGAAGGGRDAAPRRSRQDEDGHKIVGGRPRKTAQELDAEMDDYWGGGQPPPASNGAEAAGNGSAAAENATAAGGDVDMIE